jgi:hypothetical protein
MPTPLGAPKPLKKKVGLTTLDNEPSFQICKVYSKKSLNPIMDLRAKRTRIILTPLTDNQTLIGLPLEMLSQDKDKIVETFDKL